MSKLIRQRHLQAALQKTKAYVAQQVSQLAKAAASDLAQQGLGPCTHKKTGRVHALSADAEAQNLRFTAAADFAAGDTFTLNGKAIAARTPSGEGLWTGCFKKGAEVVCHKGTAGLTFSAPGVDTLSRQLLDRFYPVGSIYQTADGSFRPAAAWGGVWELVSPGVALRQAGGGENGSKALGSRYGEAQHTLTTGEMPRHKHVLTAHSLEGNSGVWVLRDIQLSETIAPSKNENNIDAAGGDQPHNNIGPSLSVNIWKRTK